MKKNLSLVIIFVTALSSAALAQGPVYFADENLKAAVEEVLGVTNPTQADMLKLTTLIARGKGISDLTGLGYAINLQELYLSENGITDINALSTLTNLRFLGLSRNNITNINTLSTLTNLEGLFLESNQIADISALSNLSNLTDLALGANQITSIRSLSNLTNLDYLSLFENQITDISALSRLTNLLVLNLPFNQISNISPLSSLTKLLRLSLNNNRINDISGLSGLFSLETLRLDNNRIINISPISRLTNLQELWLQNNPLENDAYIIYIPMIEANGTIVYYDIPVWRTLTVDSTDGGSVVEPGEGDFDFLNGTVVRISAVADSDCLFLNWTGTAVDADKVDDPGSAITTVTLDADYTLSANFRQTRHTIYVDNDAAGDPVPNDPRVSDPSEDGSPEHPYDTIQEAIGAAEHGDTILVYPGTYQEEIVFLGKAITVQGVAASDGIPVLQNPGDFAASFYNSEEPGSVLKNFVIKNSFMAIFIAGSSPTISNVTVIDNTYGIEAYAGSQPDISNSIFWGNTDDDLFQCEARYSCIERAIPGEGNISIDPLFVDPNNGDYHLRSERGRYWPDYDVWVLDKVSSTCIDGGDPMLNPFDEPKPNGSRINMGAYGGTAYASMSKSPVKGVKDEILPPEVVEQVRGITGGFWNSDSPWFIAMFQNNSDYTITQITIRVRLTDRDTNEQHWYEVVLGPPGAVIPPGETVVLTGNVEATREDKDFYWEIVEMRGYRD